jgi:hypothetical protein
MSKQSKSLVHETVHETAASALTTWRELDAAAVAARVEFQTYNASHPRKYVGVQEPPSDLLYQALIREAVVVDKEATAERASFAASAAIDAMQLAEGDADALARDPAHLRADLIALNEEEQELMNRQRDLTNRREARLIAAVASEQSIGLRRRTDKAPFLAILPPVDHRPFAKPYTDVLRDHIATPPTQPTRAPYANTLRAQAKQVAALLEHRRLEKEAKETEAAQETAHTARLNADETRRANTRAKESNAVRAEFRSRHEALARAYAERNAP